MKTAFLSLISILLFNELSQAQDYQQSIIEHQNELNEQFRDSEKSPLMEKDLKTFEELEFFPINEKFKVTATIERALDPIPFEMQTTTDRLPVYQVYCIAYFKIDGKEYKLNLYQSHRLKDMIEYADYLFLPFTDLTNDNESYGGGRFLDLEIPDGDTIIIDFNKAYNPYCAYNHKYSCPIPPKENHLKLEVKAGVKKYDKSH